MLPCKNCPARLAEGHDTGRVDGAPEEPEALSRALGPPAPSIGPHAYAAWLSRLCKLPIGLFGGADSFPPLPGSDRPLAQGFLLTPVSVQSVYLDMEIDQIATLDNRIPGASKASCTRGPLNNNKQHTRTKTKTYRVQISTVHIAHWCIVLAL